MNRIARWNQPIRGQQGRRPPAGVAGVAGVGALAYSIIGAKHPNCYPSRFPPTEEGGPRAGGGAVYRIDPATVAKRPTTVRGDPLGYDGLGKNPSIFRGKSRFPG